MDEQISTTPESTAQATSNTEADIQATEQDVQSGATVSESENAVQEGTENSETKAPKDWEKIAKDNQASYTKVSQELAELKRQLAENKPKIVDKDGKISNEYEQKYKFDIDNREFLTYDHLARQLEPETRSKVETLLKEASSLYDPVNKNAYLNKLAEVKNYFRSDIIEQITLEKNELERNMKEEFQRYINEDKIRRANDIASRIEAFPDLKELVTTESENYSEPVFGIIKQMFDLTGGIDLELTQNAIKSIKDLGVKEYLAKQNADSAKEKASVPTGSTVIQKVDTGLPTRDELVTKPSVYREACKKWGMDKIDNIIMKG